MRACPFCGSPHAYFHKYADDKGDFYVVKCTACRASGPEVRGFQDQAAEKWNDRAGFPMLVDKAAGYIWNEAENHLKTWQDEPDRRWLKGLIEGVIELTLVLVGWHKHPIDLGLAEVGSIALNWLRRHYRETDNELVFERDDTLPIRYEVIGRR